MRTSLGGSLPPLHWKSLARVAVILLALGFLVVVVRDQWNALTAYHWRLTPGWALLALAGLGLAWLFELDTWRWILRGLGGRLSLGNACGAWFLSNIIRYIPGNVWQFLGMAELNAQVGVPRIVTLTSIVLHQAISTAAGVAIAALYFAIAGETTWLTRLRPVLWLAPLVLLLLQPRVLDRLLNWALARLRREPVHVTLALGQMCVMLLRYAVVWVVMGLSFAALVWALVPIPASMVPHLAATWVAAYVIGFLSLLTPSGLGVREGVMILLLNPVLAPPLPALVAIVARLWMVLGELLGAGVALLMRPASLRLLTRHPATSDE